MFAFPLYSGVYVVAAILTLFSAGAVLWRRASPGSLPFAFTLFSLMIWSMASLFEAGALSIEGKTLASIGQYVGITALSPFWLYFCAEYSGHRKVLERPWRYLIWIVPAVTLILAMTNNGHRLIWEDIYFPKNSANNVAVYDHGAYLYFFVGYTYAALLLGSYWLVKKLSTLSKEKRTEVSILIGVLAVGWVANIIYFLGFSPVEGLDLTPISFAIIGVTLTWFIYRRQLFDLLPIARSVLFDNMTDGVIVLDNEGRVVDINEAAIDATAYAGKNPIGMTIWEMFADHLSIIAPLRNKTDLQVELEIPLDPPRYLDVKVDSIGDNDNQGQVITIRDVTERKRAEMNEREQRLFAEALTEITAILNSSLNLSNTLEKILDNVSKVVPHITANIALIDEENVLRFKKIKGYERFGTQQMVLGIESRVEDIPNMRHMAETGLPCINPDTYTDPEWRHDLPGAAWIKSYVGAPIINQGDLLGFISLDADRPNFFNQSQMEKLQVFANQAAVAIRNAQNFEEMQRLAITDSLTGLYSRRYFFEYAENEIQRSVRYQKDLSMVMLDIDHFKKVNDQFGHIIGDLVLRNVADVCRSVVRQVDVLCRFGGEEILILLPETDGEEALNVAERLCRAIAESVLQTDSGPVRVTVSVGLAALDPAHDTLARMITAADQALYMAKDAGRNSVRVFGG